MVTTFFIGYLLKIQLSIAKATFVYQTGNLSADVLLTAILLNKIKKSLAQEVRQKSDISEHRSKGWG